MRRIRGWLAGHLWVGGGAFDAADVWPLWAALLQVSEDPALRAMQTGGAGLASGKAASDRVSPPGPNSLADQAGLQPGDLIVGVGAKSVTSPDDAVSAIDAARKSGAKAIAMRIIRQGESLFVGIDLTAAPLSYVYAADAERSARRSFEREVETLQTQYSNLQRETAFLRAKRARRSKSTSIATRSSSFSANNRPKSRTRTSPAPPG